MDEETDEQLDDERTDNLVLGRLCEAGSLTVAELMRELGTGGADGADRLVGAGLAHRLDGDFIIPSAAGRHANQFDPTWDS